MLLKLIMLGMFVQLMMPGTARNAALSKLLKRMLVVVLLPGIRRQLVPLELMRLGRAYSIDLLQLLNFDFLTVISIDPGVGGEEPSSSKLPYHVEGSINSAWINR